MHCHLYATTLLLSCLAVFVSARCGSKAGKICRDEEAEIVEFPETKEDLEKACPILRNQLKCYHDEFVKCASESDDAEDQETAAQISSAYELLNDACGADPDFHEKVKSNIKCIVEVFKNGEEKCRDQVEEAMEAASNRISESDEDAVKKRNCLRSTLAIYCVGQQVRDSCGEEAIEVAGKAFYRTRSLFIADECFDSRFE